MGDSERGTVVRCVRTLFEAGSLGGLDDGQLLERFARGRDGASEMAFALLVERHGAMVFRVGRSLLADAHAAEDAFQATFLILAEKAGSLRARESIGPWLYQVAVRVASCARAATFRRRKHEARFAGSRATTSDEGTRGNDASIVHEELGALPERFRSVVVLCCLEGLSQAEAARQLGCPLGTVQSRLARGRERLRDRLASRGLAPTALFLGAASAHAAPPEALLNSTASLGSLVTAGHLALDGAISGGAVLLWKQVTGKMLMTKFKLSLLGSAALLAVAAVSLSYQPKGVAAPPVEATIAEPGARAEGDEDGPAPILARLDIGPLRVGASADVSSQIILPWTNERGALAVKVTPPPFLRVRQLRVRERSYPDKKVRFVELGFAVDTSRPGDFSEKVLVECGEQRAELAVHADVLPADARLTKVLAVLPEFGTASDEPGYYRPWFDLVKSAGLDVSYLDPSREGLPGEQPPRIDPEGRPLAPDWLKRYDVVLLADGATLYVAGWPVAELQSYVRGGGRLVVGASRFMDGSITNANAIVKPFGLEFTDKDVHMGRDAAAGDWEAFMLKGWPGDQDPLMKGVDSVVFRRGTPVLVKKEGRGKALVLGSNDELHGFVAVARDGGEVIALGPALLLGWLGEKADGADNFKLLRNLLKKPPAR